MSYVPCRVPGYPPLPMSEYETLPPEALRLLQGMHGNVFYMAAPGGGYILRFGAAWCAFYTDLQGQLRHALAGFTWTSRDPDERVEHRAERARLLLVQFLTDHTPRNLGDVEVREVADGGHIPFGYWQ